MPAKETKQPRELSDIKGDVFFLGIGGSGMYTLARLCAAKGFSVLGTDQRENENVTRLRALGVPIVPEDAPLPEGVGTFVYSLAVPKTHPLLNEAAERGIPTLHRAAFLGLFTRAFPVCAAVAGSHGKSTTTAMCAAILRAAGHAPTVLSGADLGPAEEGFSEGDGQLLLLEACEYKDAFLSLSPTHAVCLNVSFEHTDYFPSKAAVMHSFASFLSGERIISSIAPHGLFPKEVAGTTFGKEGTVTAKEVTFSHGCAAFILCREGREAGHVALNVPGEFQVENALAAAALAFSLGVGDGAALAGLNGFSGIPRRMEYKGQLRASPLYLDFAHHPRELFFSLRTAAALGAPVALVFEPHTYSRTKAFFREFVRLLRMPHMTGVLPIYAARETDTLGVSSHLLAEEAGVAYLPDYAHAAGFLIRAAGKGCTLLLVGAGSAPGVLGHLPRLTEVGRQGILV